MQIFSHWDFILTMTTFQSARQTHFRYVRKVTGNTENMEKEQITKKAGK